MTVRFAPSPTGRMHVGNFRTALIAKLWAKFLSCDLIYRYEDIDVARSTREWYEAQKADFKQLGLEPDQEYLQTQNSSKHFFYFLKSIEAQALYPCFLSRKEVSGMIENIVSAPHKPIPIYNGYWRNRRDWPQMPIHSQVSWRYRNEDPSGSHDVVVAHTAFVPELWQGSRQINDLGSTKVSFVSSYNWACALDDYLLSPQLIVRASDLKSVLWIQRNLQSMFAKIDKKNWVFPAIFHTSVVTNVDGSRLEKRTQGVVLEDLLESGYTVEEIVNCLEKSFSKQCLKNFQPSEIFSELEGFLKTNQIF